MTSLVRPERSYYSRNRHAHRADPYYIDAPLVLKSGTSIVAESGVEIRLKPGSNTCMVRNENIVGFADKPLPADLKPDTDITSKAGSGRR